MSLKEALNHKLVTKPLPPEEAAPGTPMWYERKIRQLEVQVENYKLMEIYARDILDFWPNMSFKTIRIMIPKMAALEEALKLVK